MEINVNKMNQAFDFSYSSRINSSKLCVKRRDQSPVISHYIFMVDIITIGSHFKKVNEIDDVVGRQ
jgi:hypothetical protein